MIEKLNTLIGVLLITLTLSYLDTKGQSVIIDDETQIFPKDLYVIEQPNANSNHIWIFGNALVDSVTGKTASIGVRFILDGRNNVIYDTTVLLDDHGLCGVDDVFSKFQMLGARYFSDKEIGEVYFSSAAKRVIGSGKEAMKVKSRGLGISKVVMNRKGLDTVLYYPIFSLTGYDPNGLDTTLVDTITCTDPDTSKINPKPNFGYFILFADVDFIDKDSSFYMIIPESYSIYDSLSKEWRGYYRNLIVKASPFNVPEVIYQSNWNIVDPVMWGKDKGWYWDFVEFSLYNIEVGDEFMYVGTAGSWWYYWNSKTNKPWWIDSFMIDSLVIAPVDSGLFLVVDTISFKGQMAFGYIYEKGSDDRDMKPFGTFSIYANIGDSAGWQVVTHPVGTHWLNDTVLDITITFWSLDSGAFVMMPYMWVYNIKDTFYRIDLPRIPVDRPLQATTVSLKLNVNTMTIDGFTVVDSNGGHWAYVVRKIDESNNILSGSYTTWKNVWYYDYDPSSINIVRMHQSIPSYRQHLRVTGRRFVDSGVYVPQDIEAINGPVYVLPDGRIVTLIKGFNAEQIHGANSLIFESIYEGDTLPYSFVDSVVMEFIGRYKRSWYSVLVLGCPKLDSANLLSSIGVDVGDCYLGLSDSMTQWGINISDSVYIDFDGSTALEAIFTWEDGCEYAYRFSRSWVDTNFVRSVYECGTLSVDSLIPGLAYSLYDEREQVIAVSDSGIFNISIEGTYWIGVEDTQKCVYWYTDTVEVSFAREGIGLSQIMSNDDILIVGNEGLSSAELLDPSGTILDRGILDHVGRCNGKCGNREIYRYRGSHEKLQKGVYFLRVYDEFGNEGVVKIIVQ